jgi:DNA-directed RNA polymerase subunit RPC12/RpoP
MSWEPQGLIKYECMACEKQFIVGLVDDKQAQTPVKCPFCQGRTDWQTFCEPNEDYSDWLDDMG